jgi:hypothetical protein
MCYLNSCFTSLSLVLLNIVFKRVKVPIILKVARYASNFDFELGKGLYEMGFHHTSGFEFSQICLRKTFINKNNPNMFECHRVGSLHHELANMISLYIT